MRRLFAIVVVTLACGFGAAVFLRGLEAVTEWREADPRWFFFAPLAGLTTGWILTFVNPVAGHGNLLLIALARRSSGLESLKTVPPVLSPLIVFLTWISHLGGLSVGREGTAVQMGGGLAALAGRFAGLSTDRDMRLLLHIGMSCGFAAVFGVPWAGAVFALEVSHAAFIHGPRRVCSPQSRLKPKAVAVTFFLSLAAGYVADAFARALGARHASFPAYRLDDVLGLKGLMALAAGGVIFGLIAWIFLLLLHVFKIFWSKLIREERWRALAGGLVFSLAALAAPAGWARYAGLGVPEILRAFELAPLPWDWAMKLFLTVFSIGVGFKGGEVTPLFFMGATAGASFATLFGVPPAALASVGLVAVFAAAADTPLACAVMAGELFGPAALFAAVPVCFIAGWVCRHARLYDAKPEI